MERENKFITISKTAISISPYINIECWCKSDEDTYNFFKEIVDNEIQQSYYSRFAKRHEILLNPSWKGCIITLI